MITTLAAALVLQTGAASSEMRLLRFPDVHGDAVVFTYASDLWTVDLKGGQARRITSHPGNEQNARFSPDGTWIAFTAGYDGNPDVYVVPTEGGEPRRLTFDPEADIVMDWTPDGRVAYMTSNAAWGGFTQRLRFIDPRGGVPQDSPVLEIAQGSFSPDGKVLAYNRASSHTFNWRRYRGGTQGRVSFFDFRDNSYSEVPAQREQNYAPMWVGDSVYFISDRALDTLNLFRYDTKSKRVQQLTTYSDADIKWPATDGKTIVFERDGFLWAYDIASAKTNKVDARILSDNLMARPQLRRLAGEVRSISLSPSSVRIAVEARGNIYSVPVKSGDTRLIVDDSVHRQRMPSWSPDGKWIAYWSDASGDGEIHIVPQRGGEPKQLTKGGRNVVNGISWSPDSKWLGYTTDSRKLVILKPDGTDAKTVFENPYGSSRSFEWSPDSKWIAYLAAGDNLFNALHLYNVDTGKATRVTEGYFNDDAVTWDLNGKYLYLLSSRTYQPQGGAFEFNGNMGSASRLYVIPLTRDLPNPAQAPSDEETLGDEKKPEDPNKPKEAATKIDLEGLEGRMVVLPMPAGDYGAVIGLNNAVLYALGGRIAKYDLNTRQSQDLGAIPGNISLMSFNPARTKVAYYGGGVMGVVDVGPNMQFGGGVSLAGVEAMVDPRTEWKQIFWESWRYMRDRFYDPGLLGLNWTAIGERYSAYLPYVAHRNDLNYILGLMIGELGTGHAYVGGGDTSNGMPMPAPVPIGSLGADFRTVGQYVQIARILRGYEFGDGPRGPLVEPGVNVKEGDFVLAIDGKPLRSNVNPSALLINKVGRQIAIKVNDRPSDDGARTVLVRPIGSDGALRYADWIEGNRKKVAELSGGRIGYMHVPNTGTEGFIGFARGYWSNVDKQALVVDERYNGGGDIAWYLVERLARQSLGGFVPRYGGAVYYPWSAPQGPKAMLINQYAGSGGDLFPYMFRQMKVGPLIGKRTWGGLVGITGSAPLVDGGFLTAPEFGLFDHRKGEWIAENTGVDPDIDVDLRPDLLARGEDPQLEAAVKYLLDQLQKNPPQEPKVPKFPRAPGK